MAWALGAKVDNPFNFGNIRELLRGHSFLLVFRLAVRITLRNLIHVTLLLIAKYNTVCALEDFSSIFVGVVTRIVLFSRFGNLLEFEQGVLQLVLDLLRPLEKIRVLFIVQNLIIQPLILIHFEGLKLLNHIRISDRRDGFADLLLDAEGHVPVDEVFHHQ